MGKFIGSRKQSHKCLCEYINSNKSIQISNRPQFHCLGLSGTFSDYGQFEQCDEFLLCFCQRDKLMVFILGKLFSHLNNKICNFCQLCFVYLQVEELRSKGHNPYAYEWNKTHSANQLQDIYRDLGNGEETNSENDHVSIAGRIVARRAFGKLAFLTLRDDSGTIQVFYSFYCLCTCTLTLKRYKLYLFFMINVVGRF